MNAQIRGGIFFLNEMYLIYSNTPQIIPEMFISVLLLNNRSVVFISYINFGF